MQALSRQLLTVQETERRRLARELHDELGQALTAVKINLMAMRRLPDRARVDARLDDSIALMEGALQQVRNLSLDLRPSLLDDFGLLSALRWYAEQQAARTGLTITLDAAVEALPRLPDVETALFRIAQE